jgi:hypothetical protein
VENVNLVEAGKVAEAEGKATQLGYLWVKNLCLQARQGTRLAVLKEMVLATAATKVVPSEEVVAPEAEVLQEAWLGYQD